MSASVPAGSLVRTGAERATLVRRTYSLVFVSVIVTIVGAIFTLSQPALMAQVTQHPIITMLAMWIPLLFAGRASFPSNIGFVLLFNFAMGVMLAFPLYRYGSQPGLIPEAAGLTLGAFGVLTLYAFVSRRDFSAWGSFFIVGLFILIVTSLINVFVRNQTAGLWLASASVFVFSGLLVFDTWRLRNVYGPDDYVNAAVQIYLDLLNMFLAILRILGNRRS
jgi:Integral membrane protein, interacts with FtsH